MEDYKVGKQTISKIFNTMEYGNIKIDVKEAIKWLEKRGNCLYAIKEASATPLEIKNATSNELLCTVYAPEIDIIKTIITNSANQNKWFDVDLYKRASLMLRLADEIEKNSDLFAKLEICSRGILAKDTKTKSIPLIVQYLQYYSSFIFKNLSSWKPQGIVVGVISNESELAALGILIAPALAAGYNIVVHCGTKISLATALLFELAVKVGIPEGVLKLIPSDDGDLLPYFSNENVAIVTLFVDLLKKKYVGHNTNKKVINVPPSKIPMIVFDSGDLDSAADQVIDAAWGYQSMQLWSLNTILVQENVFDKFLEKLESKIYSVMLDEPDNKLADVTYPLELNVKKYSKLIENARHQGIKFIPKENNGTAFLPTIFVGSKINSNNVINADEDCNTVSLLAFRTVDEAAALANNSRQGSGASVWTESMSLANEIAIKLKVGNVWINSYGLRDASIPISSFKNSGKGYIGGVEGFYEYMQIIKPNEIVVDKIPDGLHGPTLNAINAAKKAQAGWAKTPKLMKIRKFQSFIHILNDNRQNLRAFGSEKWIDFWLETLCEYISGVNMPNYTSTIPSYSLFSYREPRGVLVMEINTDSKSHNIKLLISAICEGNAVIVLAKDNNVELYREFIKCLPSGILTIMPFSLESSITAAMHKELGAYFTQEWTSIVSYLPVKESKIFSTVANDWENIYRNVTLIKNIWSNIGVSSQCDL